MSARLILPPDAPREEWLAARRQGVTASEIAVILGISPFDSPFNLYYKKRGEIGEDFDNDAMSLGRHLEPWIADRWATDHPEFVVSETGLWQSEDRPWQMATPDRLAQHRDAGENDWRERDALLEIKSSGTYDGWGEDGTDEIPPYYRAQVLWQLDTLGLTEAHVTCLFLSSRSIRNYTIAYDEADIDLMRCEAHAFLELVEHGDGPPPIDHTPATARALKQLHPTFDPDAEAQVPADLAQDYRYAKKSLDDARDNYDLLTNQIRHAMGDAKKALDPDGGKVATRSVYEKPGVHITRLRAEFPDAYEACRTTSTVDKLTPARRKA
ncbi:MAG TPA: YqaJ viral recombinase family protein [Jiangellaceae bacterium]